MVVFSGGMGTQILQAATYFFYKKIGIKVFADLSYFDRPLSLAREGRIGQLTHWDWQLDQYGLEKHIFDLTPGFKSGESDVIVDGQRMLELGLSALDDSDISAKFESKIAVESILKKINTDSYLCVHVRRGDYLNVASHLMGDDDFSIAD